MYDADHIYGFDIETRNGDGYHGLTPSQTFVTQISLATATDAFVFEGAEVDILEQFHAALTELPPGMLVGWNSSNFDLPMLSDRAIACGLATPGGGCDPSEWGLQLIPQPGLKPKYDYIGRHTTGYTALWHMNALQFGVLSIKTPHTHFDIAESYKAYAASFGEHPAGHEKAGKDVVPWSLKPVCEQLGISMVQLDRTKLQTYPPEVQRAYSASDAIGTRKAALLKFGLPVDLAA